MHTSAKVTPNARLLRQQELLTCGLLTRIRLVLCSFVRNFWYCELWICFVPGFMLKLKFFLSVSLFSFFPHIDTTTAVFTMSELMWAINTLSVASWSWFVSELGALVLIDCRMANLYYALFLYTDFSPKTVCTLWGECHSPITGMPSATVQGGNQLVKSHKSGHFLVSSVSNS